MAESVFSTTLQTLRKEKKVTQEQLATFLGVSPQAVSKWENGSYPEGDLLPKIADYFSVTIDYLYGKDKKSCSFEQQTFENYKDLIKRTRDEGIPIGDNAEFWETLYKRIWAAQISPWFSNKYYYDRAVCDEKDSRSGSVLFDNIGYSYLNLDKGNEFYLLLKRNEETGDFSKYLKNTKAVRELFKVLSSEENVRVITYLYTLSWGQYANLDTIAEATKVSKEKVEKLVKYLNQDISGEQSGHNPVQTVNLVNKDGKDEVAYGVDMNMAGLLFGIFQIANTYVFNPYGFNLQISNRTKSWIDRNAID